MTDQYQIRKQEFKHRIDMLYAETTYEEEGIKYVNRMKYVSNISELKGFADRNYEGEKPRLFVSTPYKRKGDTELDDVWFMPDDPKYNQIAFDHLKKTGIVPEDSQLSDYAPERGRRCLPTCPKSEVAAYRYRVNEDH